MCIVANLCADLYGRLIFQFSPEPKKLHHN